MIIDRTLLIRELLEHPAKRLVVSFPPKWSKSINLNMIKTFVQAVVDTKGQITPFTNESTVYKLLKFGEGFSGIRNETFCEPFLISQHDDLFVKYQGQYPVIHIRFRFLKGLNDVEVIDNIKIILRKIYKPHKYMTNVLTEFKKTVPVNDTVKRNKIRHYLLSFKRILEKREMNEEVIEKSVDTICKLLYRYHHKKVIVLIDDYDIPFHRLLHSSHFPETDIVHVLKYIEKIINPVLAEDYPYVERVIITSTYRITDALGQEVNSMLDYTIADTPWLRYYATTPEDHTELCKQGGKTDEQCQHAFQWYAGYKAHDNDTLNLGQAYSLTRFLASNNLMPYVYDSQEFDYVYRLIQIRTFRKLLESLINNQTLTIKSFDNLRFNKTQIRHLKHIAIAGLDIGIDNATIDLALSYLCASGFLTFTKLPNASAQVWVPNIETVADISKKLRAYYNKTYGISYVDINKLVYNIRDYVTSSNRRPLSGISIYLNKLFDHIKEFLSRHRHLDTDEFYEDLMTSMLHYMSIMWRILARSDSIVWTPPDSTISYMISAREIYGVIIAVEYLPNQTLMSSNLISMAKKQIHILEKYKHLRFVKLIGFAMDSNMTIHMRTNSITSDAAADDPFWHSNTLEWTSPRTNTSVTRVSKNISDITPT